MFSIPVVFAISAQLSAAPTAAGHLAQVPNTTVRYYDVEGRNVTEINRSIARQRPKGPNGKPLPASTTWSVSADFTRSATNGVCRVTAAQIDFKAEAELPRLADDAALEAPVRNRWANYVDLLEEGALATIAFVHQNLGTVEKAILSSDCDNARSAATHAIERLRFHTARLDAEREKRLAQQNRSLSEFRPGVLRAGQKVCKDVAATGSRVRTFRVCMPNREWERLNADAEKFTFEVQNKSISGKYF